MRVARREPGGRIDRIRLRHRVAHECFRDSLIVRGTAQQRPRHRFDQKKCGAGVFAVERGLPHSGNERGVDKRAARCDRRGDERFHRRAARDGIRAHTSEPGGAVGFLFRGECRVGFLRERARCNAQRYHRCAHNDSYRFAKHGWRERMGIEPTQPDIVRSHQF